ncbi:hypothetical protein J1605_013638 [Eschrichtius robustus]|uniref:Uncharacterized protein n=1 Tax=Eschrichtius robustus TaxID=9764 RepID=A0AB34GEK7_ESCRO|nr:hypothetical protein J1605_013638 [Eschrichtius robustus]
MGQAVQELPSLALPLLAGAIPPAEHLNHWPNCILLAMFLIYYVQRALISPFSDPRRKTHTIVRLYIGIRVLHL